jgi:NAD(P)-dependent dehydrogenase (short-subunit alcohol dehydrogenase family)
MRVLRTDLLGERRVLLAGGVRAEVQDGLVRLGANVELFDGAVTGDDESADARIREVAPVHALVFDAATAFGEGAQMGLQAGLEEAWITSRAVAAGALIPAESGGKIVLLAPRCNAGSFAEAARAALENLGRTLSVEWARHGITTTVIAPGPATTDEQVTVLVAFLLSPAGDYFSGCRFELGSVTTGGRR